MEMNAHEWKAVGSNIDAWAVSKEKCEWCWKCGGARYLVFSGTSANWQYLVAGVEPNHNQSLNVEPPCGSINRLVARMHELEQALKKSVEVFNHL
jgi:hypothetical protein